MTIKKTMKVKPIGAPSNGAGGAAIADRFKLDMPDPNARKATGGRGATAAGVAALIALMVTGLLTYMLWKHWEFLMPA